MYKICVCIFSEKIERSNKNARETRDTILDTIYKKKLDETKYWAAILYSSKVLDVNTTTNCMNNQCKNKTPSPEIKQQFITLREFSITDSIVDKIMEALSQNCNVCGKPKQANSKFQRLVYVKVS